MEPGRGEIIIYTTVAGEDQARDFARGLVERRLVACVSAISGVMSRYFWQSEAMTEDHEVLLLLKTHRDKLPDLERYFADEHPYEVPEFLVVEAVGVSAPYREWMRAEMKL